MIPREDGNYTIEEQHASTIEEQLAAISAQGYRLNNLFQRDDGTWQANLRTADANSFGGFGRGNTASEALGRALNDVPPLPPAPIYEPPRPKAPEPVSQGVFD